MTWAMPRETPTPEGKLYICIYAIAYMQIDRKRRSSFALCKNERHACGWWPSLTVAWANIGWYDAALRIHRHDQLDKSPDEATLLSMRFMSII